jgi:short-subunit dehydrogenase
LEQTEGAGRPIDVLVNNAGIASYEDFLDLSWGQVAAQIQINVTAVTELCHRFAPRMVERGRGHILNIASIAAYAPTPGYCVYGPTKAFVRNMTETLDFELRGTGVRATCVNPGGVRTEFLDKLGQVPTSRGQALLMPADRCARLAVDAMLAGRRNTITGWSNALGMWLLRLLPRAWYPTLAKFSMDLAVTKQR